MSTKLKIISGLSVIACFFLIVGCKNDKVVTIVVAGHTYGEPNTSTNGLYQPFLTQLEKQKNIDFCILTGDIVQKPTIGNWDKVDEQTTAFSFPFLFAPGNHDMGDRPLYLSRYGKTNTTFIKNNYQFVLLDNTKNGWGLDSNQLALITNTNNQSKAIFVFMHNVLWQEKHPNCFSSNSLAGKAPEPYFNFWIEVEPALKKIEKPIYLIAGDVGATKKSKNISYRNENNIHYITSGMGNKVFDNFLILRLGNEIKIDVVSLHDGSLSSIKNYTCE